MRGGDAQCRLQCIVERHALGIRIRDRDDQSGRRCGGFQISQLRRHGLRAGDAFLLGIGKATGPGWRTIAPRRCGLDACAGLGQGIEGLLLGR